MIAWLFSPDGTAAAWRLFWVVAIGGPIALLAQASYYTWRDWPRTRAALVYLSRLNRLRGKRAKLARQRSEAEGRGAAL